MKYNRKRDLPRLIPILPKDTGKLDSDKETLSLIHDHLNDMHQRRMNNHWTYSKPIHDQLFRAYNAELAKISDKKLDESAVPTNNAGDGNVDGIGVGEKGEPGQYKSLIMRRGVKRKKSSC